MRNFFRQFQNPIQAKRRTFTIILVGALLIVLWWFYSHAYLEITIDNPENSSISYALTNQRDRDTINITGSEVGIKKLVRKGNYEILISQDDASYFEVIKSGSFLTTQTIRAKLVPENDRKFVGDNPASCMHFTGQILFSLSCQGAVNDLQLHVPASANQPTHTIKSSSPIEGLVEGIVKIEGETVILLLSEGDEDTQPSHILYRLHDDLSISEPRILTGLDPNKVYSIQAYDTGFIVHDQLLKEVWEYSSTMTNPLQIRLENALKKPLTAYSLSARDQAVAIAYTEFIAEDELVDGEREPEKKRVEVVLKEGNEIRVLKFKKFATVILCGDSKLCLLSPDSQELEIYDISGKKQSLIYKIGSVETIKNFPGGLLVAREGEIILLDVAERKGFKSYDLGDYEYCGIETDGQGYTLCLSNSEQRRVALHINQAAINTDSIDKKIFDLQAMDEISAVSIYDNYIFISPELGEVVYDEVSGFFTYDPGVKKSVNSRIDQAISSLSINRDRYTIINTLE